MVTIAVAAIMCGGKGTRMKKEGIAAKRDAKEGERGTEVEGEEEKPMAMLAKKYRFIEQVISALEKSGRFEKIVGVVSPNTPATKKFLVSRGIETIDTQGSSYVQDLSILLEKFASSKLLVVPADLPLLTGQIVEEIVERLSEAIDGTAKQSEHPFLGQGISNNSNAISSSTTGSPAISETKAASIVTERSFAVEKVGITPSVVVIAPGGDYHHHHRGNQDRRLCHSGITLFDIIPSISSSSIIHTSSITTKTKPSNACINEVQESYVIMNKIEVTVNVNTKREKEVAEALLVKRANNFA